jgi:hypothetical protein
MTAKGRTANAPIPTLANARGTADANSGNQKDAGKLVILVRFLDSTFPGERAATMVGTSNPAH